MAKQTDVETLERGNIYFFYRPRVEQEDPQELGDVQNLYLVFSPHAESKYRLGIIGRKRLPDPEAKRQRIWDFISEVEKQPKRIVKELQGEEYETKTRGTRHLPAARPAGEGVYRILRHNDHTHFAYALELPDQPGQVQQEIEIEEQGNYVISVKNPDKSSPPSAGLGKHGKAEYPKTLQGKFRDRRFIDVDPPRLLDYDGSEFVLISSSEDVKEDLGVELNPQDESESTAEIFRDLRLEKSQQPLVPLFEGRWD